MGQHWLGIPETQRKEAESSVGTNSSSHAIPLHRSRVPNKEIGKTIEMVEVSKEAGMN